jgi:hypothetical protein
LSKLSGIWQDQTTQFSAGQSLPQSVILNENEGRYSVDADKSMDASIDTNILASLVSCFPFSCFQLVADDD